MRDLFEKLFDPVSRIKGREMPDRAINLDLPGMKHAGVSMDYKAGQTGNETAANKYAKKTVTAKHAAKLVKELELDDASDLILVPIPSATGKNKVPEAIAARLAALTGGKVRKLLETTVTQSRPGKGIMRRLANPKHFVGGEFPGDLPHRARVVLVDDTMHAGASIREASRQLWHTGTPLSGAVIGAHTGPTTELRVSDAAVAELRGEVGQRLPVLERLIGMPIDGSHLTMAEYRELRARIRAGQSIEEIGAHLDEARRTPGLPDESAGPSVITKSKTAVDDFPTERERILDQVRGLIADGDIRPSWQGIQEFARRLTKAEKIELFGFTGLTNAKKNVEAREALELVLLQLGYGVRGSQWEGVLDSLESVEKGVPAYKIRGLLEAPGGLVQEKEGVKTLTLYGQQALRAIREEIRVGGEPQHVIRLTEQLQGLESKRMQKLRHGQTMPPGMTHRITTKRRILASMGKQINEDVAYQDWLAASQDVGAPPPGTPPAVAGGRDDAPKIRMPEPEEIYAAPIARIVRQLNKVRAETEALERSAVIQPKLSTDRGLGYFPHYLGDAGSVIGKFVRANGMLWEKEIARMNKMPGEMRPAKAGKMSAQEVIESVVKMENQTRRAMGRAEIAAPEPDSPLSAAIADLLAQNPDMKVIHQSMLMRTFLSELTIAEINSLAEYTGVAFRTNPVSVWKDRRTMAHLAVGGADFLKEAIKQGVEDGFVVAIKGRGQVPEGFERITDSRFGNVAKGYAFSKELVREFKKFQNLSEKPHVVLRAVDWLTQQWRTSVLGVAPYTMTNLLSGVFQANIFDAYRMKTWDAVRRMMMDIHNGVTGKTVNSFVKLPGEIGRYDIQDFYTHLAIEHGELGKGLHGIEMEKAVQEGYRTEWGILAQFKGAFTGDTKAKKLLRGLAGVYRDEKGLHANLSEAAYFRGFRAFNVAVEDWMAMSFMTERLRRGDPLSLAIQKKRLALNQSADLTDFELNVFRRMIPFWGWMKGNAVLQAVAAVNRPQLAAAVTRVRGNLETAFAGDAIIPTSLRPRHVAEEMGVQLTPGPNAQFVNLTRAMPVREIGITPFAGLDMPGNIAEEAIQRLNPVAKVPGENIINRDLYWDRKVEEYEGQRRRFLGVNLPPKSKRLARLVRQLNVVEQMSWRGVPATGSDAAFAAAQLTGVRAFPVDAQRQIFARERELNDTIGSVMRDMHRARTYAERAGDPWQQDPEVIRLAEIYAGLVEQRDALPMKAIREFSKEWMKERRGQRKELKQYAVESN
jgi:pyrimidine operon attenuation protein/uracil phosphoribosyltransferase